MEREPGLYVTLLSENRIKKSLTDEDGEVTESEVSIADELMYYSEVSYEPYWELLNHLENMELCKAGSAENSWDITGFEQMLQILNDMIPMLKENNLTTGILANELLANIYFDCVARDATIHQLRDTYVAHLRSVVEVQFYINQLLYDLEHNVPIDTVKKYECFQLFYFMEQVFFDGTQVTRQYHFKSEADYMVFLLLHFVESGLQICNCKCCGRYFVPRTKRKTLYCDRIIRNDQTCKELAPSLKHKLTARNERVVAEYDRTKQRMYKRYERSGWGKKPSDKDLSYGDYLSWSRTAAQARDKFLAGELTEEEALAVIVVP